LTLFSSSPAASARATVTHQTSEQHRTSLGMRKRMSASQVQKAAQLATFYNAVIAHEEASYLQALVTAQRTAFFQALALHQLAEAQAAAAAAAAAAAEAPAPAGGGSDATSANTPDWACIRQHESSDNYSEGGGGAYQFELGTWEGLTGLPNPAEEYPPAVQDAAALKLYSERGWEPWTTRFVCGL
jgi:hypothetical protein